MPKGGYMSGIFGRSPVSPLQEHMAKVYACASELVPLFNAVINEDWDAVLKHQQSISNLEKEADVLKKELRLNLPKGLFMPVSRHFLAFAKCLFAFSSSFSITSDGNLCFFKSPSS